MRRINVSSGAKWESLVGYSRLVRVGARVFVTGTTAFTPDGRIAGEGDAYAQAMRSFQNIEAALARAGAALDDIVRTRMFVTDIERDWEAVGRAHAEKLGHVAPATSMIEVSRLIDPRMLVEIKADAIVTGEGGGAGVGAEGPGSGKLAITSASFNDHAAIGRLLEAASLPVPDAEDRPVFFLVARAPDGEVIGCVGAERYDKKRPLLRSLSVAASQRGAGLGQRLVRELAARLYAEGCEAIYLLTLDAQDFFARLGFAPLPRKEVPEGVRASREFSIHACDGATAMTRTLPLA